MVCMCVCVFFGGCKKVIPNTYSNKKPIIPFMSEILADGFSRLELPYVSIAFSVYPLITCKFSVLSLSSSPTPRREEEEEEGGGQDPSCTL